MYICVLIVNEWLQFDYLLITVRRFVGHFMSRRERNEKNGATPQHFTNVYMKNFPEEIDTDEKLAQMFSEHGKIVSAKVMLDSNGKSRGFGFCSFESPADAEQVNYCIQYLVLQWCFRMLPENKFNLDCEREWGRLFENCALLGEHSSSWYVMHCFCAPVHTSSRPSMP